MTPDTARPGGDLSFLLAATPAGAVGAPEALGEDERLMEETIREFMEREVLPRSDAIETGAPEVILELFGLAADVGLTGLEAPERFGGLGLDLTTSMLVAAQVARHASFSTTVGAHFGIGTFPLAIFGAEPLRQRYLPQLVTAQRIAAYALTEAGAGSDALGIRTRATRAADGGWVLDGGKQFITNAGIAGLYTVFAKVDGEAFTAFAVPGEADGVTTGLPERKMGLKGSITASLTLDGVRVPADHVIGEVGKGHRVAFNTLNLGRMKLGFGALGYMRDALAMSASYAAERRQFGRPIGEFGLIRAKLAEMAARTFLVQGVAFRTARSLDAALPDGLCEASPTRAGAALKAHSAATAMVKVFGTEHLAWVADEAVQVHGGYGFMEEYPVCRIYRDVRVKRIYEGTNEVNRLLAAGALFKRGMTGELPLSDVFGRGAGAAPGAAPGAEALAEDLRWAIGKVAAQAMARLGAGLQEEQTVLAGIADLMMELFALDTACARTAADPRLLAIATEIARARCLATTAPLAARLGLDPASLVGPLAAGAGDISGEVDAVAAGLLEDGATA